MDGCFKKRTVLIRRCYFFAYSIIFLRLLFIHFYQVEPLTTFSTKQMSGYSRFRAPILDRYGRLVAGSIVQQAAFINPCALQKPAEIALFLKDNFSQAYLNFVDAHEKQFMYVKKQITDQEYKLIQKAGLSDIKCTTCLGRSYPIQAMNTIVGVVGVDNRGLCGIEYQYNEYLTSSSKPIVLTVDAALQFLAQEELQAVIEKFNASSGAVIVMNPDNGHILAMVSLPTFETESITSTNTVFMNNKVVTESYEPGSVVKVFAALAALEEQQVKIDEIIDCKNSTTAIVDGRTINTPTAHAMLTFADVIALSNNIGMASIVQRLGTKLYEHYERMGFGKKTGIPFPGEHAGFVNAPEWWSKQSIFSLSYGYELLVTPIQLACAFCIIANNGYQYQKPILVSDDTIQSTSTTCLYTKEAISLIKQILERTALRGTARSAQLAGFTIMAKTGTANMVGADGRYDRNKNIFTCAGIVQKGDYQRVIVVCVKETAIENLYASRVAAPLFERIAHVTVINDDMVV